MSAPALAVAEPSPALGFSILANIGDNRQITCQCFVGVDEDLPVIHARIDKVQAVIDRQRALCEIPDLEAEREKHQVQLTRAEDDLSRIEQEFHTGQAQFDAAIHLLAGEIKEIEDEAYGRRTGGPVGAAKSRRDACKAEQKNLVEAKDKAKAERDQFRQNVVISIGRFREEIEKLDAKLAKARALTAGD